MLPHEILPATFPSLYRRILWCTSLIFSLFNWNWQTFFLPFLVAFIQNTSQAEVSLNLPWFDHSQAPAFDLPTKGMLILVLCSSVLQGECLLERPHYWASSDISMWQTLALQIFHCLIEKLLLLLSEFITYFLQDENKNIFPFDSLPLWKQSKIVIQTLLFLLFLPCYFQWYLSIGHSLLHVLGSYSFFPH